MSNEPYILITADTHAGGSHAQYREHLDPKYRKEFDEWRGGYRNPSEEHYGKKKKRNWDLDIRSADQNGQGVVGEVVFPNTVPPFYKKSIVTAGPPKPDEYEHCLAGIRAHNRWLKEFCEEDPLRRAGIGVILPNDLDEAIEYYVEGLDCGLVRRYPERATLNFFGDQLVVHRNPGKVESSPEVYPRHFGIIFHDRARYARVLELARSRGLPFLEEPLIRCEGAVEENETFYLLDPSNNVLEFKAYRNPDVVIAP